MANEEQIAILKKHGAEAWNAWRTQHPDVRPDLSRADLFRTILIEAHLEKANLIEANLSGAGLIEANLREATNPT